MQKGFASFLLISVALCLQMVCIAQFDSVRAPYMLSPSIPAFTIMKAPDSSLFSQTDLHQKRPTIFFVFNPDCEYCQHETKDLLRNINKFRNAQIVMVSYMTFDMIADFYKKYKIANYPDITMGRDTEYKFLKFYKLKILPSTIVYDSNGKFKKIFRERVDMEDLLLEL